MENNNSEGSRITYLSYKQMNLLKKKLQLLFLLVLASPLHAQIDDIEILGGLVEGISSIKKDTQILPEDEVIEDDMTDVVRKEYSDLQYNSFGYTGGDSFLALQKPKSNNKPLKLFGYDFFTNQPSTFIPLKNIPVPEDYLIGPGDNVKLLIYGNQNDEFTVQVTREGDILLPNIGRISVAGITFSEMKETIKEVLRKKIIGAEVNISLGTLRAINIFILGDAFEPGMFTVSGLSTLTNAIFVSGGVSLNGSLRNIELKRNGETIKVFDFYDLLLKGDTSKDVRLRPGDVIFIPPKSKSVAITGEIARPGIYELKEFEKLNDLITFAGNLRPEANSKKIEIQRIDHNLEAFRLLSVSLRENSEIALKNGDYVNIFPVNDILKQSVLVKGHALNPGFYPWYEGLKISNIFGSEEDLLSMTDKNYLLIKREKELSQNYEYYQASLSNIFQDSSSPENIQLNEKDEILLLPSLLFKDQINTRFFQQELTTTEEEMILVEEPTYTTTDEVSEDFDKEDSIDAEKEALIYVDKEHSIYDYCILATETADGDAMAITGDAMAITDSCRRQLIDPYIILINKQIDNLNKTNLIDIQGNVHFPGTYPLTLNMTIKGAIDAGGGLKDGTYFNEIEVVRTRIESGQILTSNTLYSGSVKSQINTSLTSQDLIHIKKMTNNTKDIAISGEIMFPGVYRLSENETLLDLINRAGGLKKTAETSSAYFQRESVRILGAERLRTAQGQLKRKILLSSQSAGIGKDSLSAGAMETLTRLLESESEDNEFGLGRLIIDLDAIMDGSQLLVLEDGDSLHIPIEKQTIAILGEVYVPYSHLYSDNLDLSDYLKLSGGTTEFADLDSTYIIKSDGTIVSSNKLATNSGFFRGSKSILQPGDTVIVPVKLQQFDAIKATTELTQILYQMSIAAAAVNSF